MFPWIVYWAPTLTFPFGGAVAQRIEPTTSWFFDGIAPASGNGDIERRAFDVASYGRQLGLITELLLDLAAQQPPATDAGQRAQARLADIRQRIEQVKNDDAAALLQQLDGVVEQLRQRHPQALDAVRQRLLPGP